MTNPSCQLLQHYSDRLAQVTLSVSTIGLLRRVVSDEIVKDIESRLQLLGDTWIAIYLAIAEDSSKLQSLVTSLLETKEAVSLANEISCECKLIDIV